MKRNLQEKEWADQLKKWENASASQPWDRPAEGGWDRLTEDLDDSKEKPFLGWWKTTLILVGLIGLVAILYDQSFTTGHYAKSENLPIESAPLNNNKEFKKSPAEAILDNDSNLLKEKNTNQINAAAQKRTTTIANPTKKRPTPKNNRHFKTDFNASEEKPTSTNLLTKIKAKKKEAQTTTSKTPFIKPEFIQKDSIANIDILTLPQAAIQDKKSSHQTANPSILAETNTLKNMVFSTNTTTTQTTSFNKNSILQSEQIPTLSFKVESNLAAAKMTPLVNHLRTSQWSIDAYAQYSLQTSFRPFSPIWQLQKEKEQSFGLQLNRKIGQRFSAHIGAQKRSDLYSIKGVFLRRFDRDNEDNMGATTFRLSTSIDDEKNIEEDIVVQRNTAQPTPDNTNLLFHIERETVLETLSIPIGISYCFWQSYPFQLSGVFGGEYSRVKISTTRRSISLNHPVLSLRPTNSPARTNTFIETDFSLQASLRLDAHLTPKLKAMAQIDWQNGTQNQRGILLGSGNQLRLGLSYTL